MTAYVQSFEEELEKIAFNFAKMAPQGAGMLAGGALGLASTSKQGPGESAGGFATRALINTGIGAGMGFAGGKGVQALGFKNMKQIGKASKKGLRSMGILEKPKGVQKVKETLGDVMEGLLDNQKAVIGGLGLAGAATLLHGPTRQKILNAFQGISLDQINAFRQRAPQLFNEFVDGIKNGNLSAETINKVKAGFGSVGVTVSKAWDDLVGGTVPSAGKMQGGNPQARQAMRNTGDPVTVSQKIDAEAARQGSVDDVLGGVDDVADDVVDGAKAKATQQAAPKAKPTQPAQPVSATGSNMQSGAPTTPVGQNVTQANTPSPVAGGPVPSVATTSAGTANVQNANVQQGFNQEMQALDDQLKVLDDQINSYTQGYSNLTVQVPQGAPVQAAPRAAAPQAAPAASPQAAQSVAPQATRPVAPAEVQAVAPQAGQGQTRATASRAQSRQTIDPNARNEVTQELPPARVPGDEFDVNEVSDFLPTGQVRARRATAPTRQDDFDVSDVSDFMTTGALARRQSARAQGAQNARARQAVDDVFDDGEVTQAVPARIKDDDFAMYNRNKPRHEALKERGMVSGNPGFFLNGRSQSAFLDELAAIEARLARGGENSVRSQISNAETRVGAARQRLQEARQGGNQSEIMAARKELNQSQRQLSSVLEDTASDVLQGDPRVGVVSNALTQGNASRERQIASILRDLTEQESRRLGPDLAKSQFIQDSLRREAIAFRDSPRFREIGRAILGRQRRLQGQIDQVSAARPVSARPQPARQPARSNTDLEATRDLGTRRGAETTYNPTIAERIPRTPRRPRRPEPTEEVTRFTRVPRRELEPTEEVTRFTRVPKSQLERTSRVTKREIEPTEVIASLPPVYQKYLGSAQLPQGSRQRDILISELNNLQKLRFGTKNSNNAVQKLVTSLNKSNAPADVKRFFSNADLDDPRVRRQLVMYERSFNPKTGKGMTVGQIEKVGHQNKMKQLSKLILGRR